MSVLHETDNYKIDWDEGDLDDFHVSCQCNGCGHVFDDDASRFNPNYVHVTHCPRCGNDADPFKGYRQTKLGSDEANMIRDLFATGNYSQQELADMFDVSRRHINLIINRERWA